jgi:hypothetical protein
MNAVKTKLIDVCIIVTITLAMLVGLELAARLLSYADERNSREDVWSLTVQKQEWGKQYLVDDAGTSWRHATYVEFREKPYTSPTINVDSEGRRRVPGSCERENAFTIWTFGGSTMFGYGAPDQFTIPAYLATIFSRGSRCAKVVNYGAAYWQSSQSLVQLIQALARGGRPDAVIFYDGINEVGIVASGGAPGGIASDAESLLERALDPPQLGIPDRIARQSVLIRTLRNRVFRIPQKGRDEERSRIVADIPGQARAVAGIYAQNVRMVDALANEYGFKAYFFLQPFPLISGKKGTDMEKAILRKETEQWDREADIFRSFYLAFGQNAYLASHPRYFDISGMFDGMAQELYADSAHLLPEGNKLVAERIAEEMFRMPKRVRRQGGK